LEESQEEWSGWWGAVEGEQEEGGKATLTQYDVIMQP